MLRQFEVMPRYWANAPYQDMIDEEIKQVQAAGLPCYRYAFV